VSSGPLEEPVTIPPAADLAVAKTASPRRVAVGQLVTYTIVVRNLGPDAAANVVVTDRLPAGLAFVSAHASQGTYRPGTGRWAVGTLVPGGFATLVVTARVAAVATVRNTATASSTTFDPDLSNNTASDVISAFFPVISKRQLLASTFL